MRSWRSHFGLQRVSQIIEQFLDDPVLMAGSKEHLTNPHETPWRRSTQDVRRQEHG
jgi:hypothetical protein